MPIYTISEAVYVLDSVTDPKVSKEASVSFWGIFDEDGVFLDLTGSLERAEDTVRFNLELRAIIENPNLSPEHKFRFLLRLGQDEQFTDTVASILILMLRKSQRDAKNN